VRIKPRLSPQKHTSQGKQSVRNAPQGTTVRMAALAESRVSGTTLGIALTGDTGPVIDCVAQANVRGVAHDDNPRLTAAPSDRRGPTQRPQRLIVPAAKRSRGFAEQRRQVDPADTGQGLED
jgi:hypothetical protein